MTRAKAREEPADFQLSTGHGDMPKLPTHLEPWDSSTRAEETRRSDDAGARIGRRGRKASRICLQGALGMAAALMGTVMGCLLTGGDL